MSVETNIQQFAMYVIAEVESNFTWNSVYYADPITLGMWQFYGVEAAEHLHAMKEETPSDYVRLSSTLRGYVEAHSKTDEWWNSYNWLQADGNSWAAVAEDSTDNHVLQQKQIEAKMLTDIATLKRWGMTTDHPQEMAFMLCVYHQRPVSAQNILRSAGANAKLQKLLTTTLNDNVLSRYKNRYNTAYARCNAWDGESVPPDYGQVDPTETGGDSPTIATRGSDVQYIIQSGDQLILYGQAGSAYADGVVCYPAGAQRWVPSRHPAQTVVEGGNYGDGSDTGAGAGQKVVDFVKSEENKWSYGQGAGRQTPETSGYEDCSSMVWRAYKKVTGINVGTWTGEQKAKGTSIASGNYGEQCSRDLALPADLLLVTHTNGVDHVEMYTGDGELWGHGSGKGPHKNSRTIEEYSAAQSTWELRRYL